MQNKSPKLSAYILGYGFSLILTLLSFAAIVSLSGTPTASLNARIAIFVLALLQFIIQIICFLHLGTEDGPRWKTIAFGATLGLIVIIVGGSLWIMSHLAYNMTPQDVSAYMKDQQGGF